VIGNGVAIWKGKAGGKRRVRKGGGTRDYRGITQRRNLSCPELAQFSSTEKNGTLSTQSLRKKGIKESPATRRRKGTLPRCPSYDSLHRVTFRRRRGAPRKGLRWGEKSFQERMAQEYRSVNGKTCVYHAKKAIAQPPACATRTVPRGRGLIGKKNRFGEKARGVSVEIDQAPAIT